MPFLGSVIISDCVHGVDRSPILQILLQISVKTSIMVSLPARTSSADILSTPADFPFFSDATALSTSSIDLRLGADCSPVLCCHHDSHGCTDLRHRDVGDKYAAGLDFLCIRT